jgi:formylaminopyrimidine deformylase / aminopyrimidine aminohydrolase
VPVAELLSRLPGHWRAATRHRFLDGVRDGTLPPAAFDRWLVQDAHFVADLLWFQARLLARAPREAQPVLVAGAAALVDELAWFDDQAARRGLLADAPRQPATAAYTTLLGRLDTTEPPAALTALWAIERVYLEAWSSAAPGAPEYAPFLAHWTTPKFAAYIKDMERAADRLLAEAEPLEALVTEVLRAEVAFWDMAVGGL